MKNPVFVFLILMSFLFAGCFSEKDSVFYDSEWIMQNYDSQGNLYYHQLILEPGHKAVLRAAYADSSKIMEWTGSYKINSKKINFNFSECVRSENGKIAEQYTSGKMIKFYSGEFFYSVAELGEEGEEKKQYHLELIRPKNYFYGKNTDIFGNKLEEFVKVNRSNNSDEKESK